MLDIKPLGRSEAPQPTTSPDRPGGPIPVPPPVAAEPGRSLDFAKAPAREKGEVLAAFAAHKDEVPAGYGAK